MTTIPASALVAVNPSVLSAGGTALALLGMVLTQSTRVPIGQVLSFPNDGVSVANFFGPAAPEVATAQVYFAGFDNSTKKPSAILFAQYNSAAAAAYLRGGKASGLTLAELKALTGSLTVTMDGYDHTAASIDLSAATSFSSAAALLQTQLNASEPTEASVTGSIAAESASVTASIAGNVMYVTAVGSGVLVPGSVLSGTGVSAGTEITSQLSGTPGGIGTYAVSIAQVTPSTTVSTTYGLLTVTAVGSGTVSVGQTLSGSGVTSGTQITGLDSGTGLTGTYYVQTSQTASSTTITASGTAIGVAYDSISGGFDITSGIAGPASTVAFATGSAAASLFLTQATGAVLSQGAAAASPAAFMTAIAGITQNWASFMTQFDPDGGVGNVQKQAFASWVNGQNDRWLYVAWDHDVTPTESDNATTSLGNILKAADSSGTAPVYEVGNQHLAAFVCGMIASIDYEATNGRITTAFKGQTGLVASVTDETSAANLIANGYNFYGAYATAAQQFLEFQPGSVSGPFEWLDSYVDQIWLNNALQLALMELLVNTNSVPYNQNGYELIKAACDDPINAALNAGVIRAGVTLSAAQIAEVNAAAGTKVNDVIQNQGWYLQVLDASPSVRQARQSPEINLWYTDGQAVQAIVLSSIEIQ